LGLALLDAFFDQLAAGSGFFDGNQFFDHEADLFGASGIFGADRNVRPTMVRAVRAELTIAEAPLRLDPAKGR
jgi:hypothetical protein